MNSFVRELFIMGFEQHMGLTVPWICIEKRRTSYMYNQSMSIATKREVSWFRITPVLVTCMQEDIKSI